MQAMLALIDMPRLPELIIILVVALLVFGRRLPDVARSMGRSINEFKKGLRQAGDDTEQVEADSAAPVKPIAAKPAQGAIAKEPAAAAAAPKAADPLEERAAR